MKTINKDTAIRIIDASIKKQELKLNLLWLQFLITEGQ